MLRSYPAPAARGPRCPGSADKCMHRPPSHQSRPSQGLSWALCILLAAWASSAVTSEAIAASPGRRTTAQDGSPEFDWAGECADAAAWERGPGAYIAPLKCAHH